MKRILLTTMLLAVILAPAAQAGDTLPLTLAGITLGQDIGNYAKCCDMQLKSPIPDAPYLNEVHLSPDFIPGVRGGSLTTANCDRVGQIVRIKFKFHDRSKAFFEDLLDKYKDKFGDPDSYEGDTFRNIIAWQWNFSKGDQRVTLLLMWSREKEMRPGVSIKMTYASLLESEYDCFKEKFSRMEHAKGGPSKIRSLGDFVPR